MRENPIHTVPDCCKKEHTPLVKNTIKFLQQMYPSSIGIVTSELPIKRLNENNGQLFIFKKMGIHLVCDMQSGTNIRVITLPLIANPYELKEIVKYFDNYFLGLKKTEISQKASEKGKVYNNVNFPFSGRSIIYTDISIIPVEEVENIFEEKNILISLFEESKMYKSVFISYGGPVEKEAEIVNNHLKKHNVKTWFYPENKVPGKKLHRTMSEGIIDHDVILFVCTHETLNRAGVLNELERVLEREADEGGSSRLIVLSLEIDLFKKWTPPSDKKDVKRHLMARNAEFLQDITDEKELELVIDRILKALRK